MPLRYLAKTLAPATIATDGLVIQCQRSAPDVTSFEPGAPHAAAHPLVVQVGFRFCDRTVSDDHSTAQRATGIDLFAERDELDVEPVQLVEHFEEVLDRPGDPVRGPDH